MAWTVFSGTQSIAASGSYTSDVIDVAGQSRVKIGIEVTYNASATAGCHAVVVPYQPDGSTAYTDDYVTAVVPDFTAGATKSKLSGPIDVAEIDKIVVKVYNDDTAQTLTLKKIFLH